MLVLDTTARSLVIKLAGAVTTNELEFSASYADQAAAAFTPGLNIDDTNGASEVTLVAAPAASTYRQVKTITVHNKDTVAATVIIEFADGATRRRVLYETLAVNATLILDGARLTNGLQGVTNGDAHDHSGGDGAAIPAAGLAIDAVETAKVKDEAITTAKLAPGVLLAGKNLIINGDFDVWQRGTSFAALATAGFSADRFKYEKSGAMVHTLSRDTDVPTVAESGHKSNYSLKVDCTTVDASIAAGDFCCVEQIVEGYNFKRVAQRPAVLTFWAKATKTGTYCAAFLNHGTDRSYIVEYTINTTNTWEKKTIPLPASPAAGTWDYTTGAGIRVYWMLACGSTYQATADVWQTGAYLATANQVNACDSTDNNFWLAQVQLEDGETATEFESRDIATETVLCQRYYQKSYEAGLAPGTSDNEGALCFNVGTDGSGIAYLGGRFEPRMRIPPAITAYRLSGAANTWDYARNGASGTFTPVVDMISEGSFRLYSSNLGVNWGVALVYGHWVATAEI